MGKKETQKDRVLRYMRDFGTITQGQAYEDIGVGRLSARICELRHNGYKIKTVMINRKNRYNETVSIAQYSICA